MIYALVVLSLMLGVSVSAASFALSELKLVRAGYQSLSANYAAEAAAECALYWRFLNGPAGTYECEDASGTFVEGGKVAFTVNFSDGSCASVVVDDAARTIRSRGYNACGGNGAVGKFERGYLIQY